MYNRGMNNGPTIRVVLYRSGRYRPLRNSNRKYQNTWVNEILDIDERLFEYGITIVVYTSMINAFDCSPNIVQQSDAYFVDMSYVESNIYIYIYKFIWGGVG